MVSAAAKCLAMWEGRGDGRLRCYRRLRLAMAVGNWQQPLAATIFVILRLRNMMQEGKKGVDINKQ